MHAACSAPHTRGEDHDARLTTHHCHSFGADMRLITLTPLPCDVQQRATAILSRLRHVVCRDDGYVDGDDDVREDAETDDILGPWPTKIVGHAGHFSRDYGHYEDDGWASRGGSDISAFLLPGRSLARAPQPDKLRSQTAYHCPTCGQHAWATPTAQLLCGICKRPMQAYL